MPLISNRKPETETDYHTFDELGKMLDAIYWKLDSLGYELTITIEEK